MAFETWIYISYDRPVTMKKTYPFIDCNKNHNPCDACYFAKQKNCLFLIALTYSLQPFDLIHVDIWGPISIPSSSGHRYSLTIVDDNIRHTQQYFMKLKSETSIHMKSFVQLIETQFDKKLKCVRSDKGPEFMLTNFYSPKGICIKPPVWKLHKQSGSVEITKHHHIVNTTRALLF